MPRYDPIQEKMVPTDEERTLRGDLEDIRREIRSARDKIIAETDARTRSVNRNAMDATNAIAVLLLINLIATIAIAVKVWFFS